MSVRFWKMLEGFWKDFEMILWIGAFGFGKDFGRTVDLCCEVCVKYFGMVLKGFGRILTYFRWVAVYFFNEIIEIRRCFLLSFRP